MGKFLVGLVLGVLVGGGVTYVQLDGWPGKDDPVDEALPDAASEPDDERDGKRRRRRRGRGRRAPGGNTTTTDVVIDEDIELSARDRQVITVGDSLALSERTVDMAGGDTRNLSQGEIDGAIRQRADAIIGCITRARGPAPLSGRVNVGFVVDARGNVTRQRIEAARYLVDEGLVRCLGPVLSRLSFPAVGKETVVRVPFDFE